MSAGNNSLSVWLTVCLCLVFFFEIRPLCHFLNCCFLFEESDGWIGHLMIDSCPQITTDGWSWTNTKGFRCSGLKWDSVSTCPLRSSVSSGLSRLEWACLYWLSWFRTSLHVCELFSEAEFSSCYSERILIFRFCLLWRLRALTMMKHANC